MRRTREDLPAVANFSLGLSQMQAASKDSKELIRPAAKPNQFFKISLCKNFVSGHCAFGDACHFAHGEAELRAYPRDTDKFSGGTGDDPNDHHAPGDYYQGGSAGGGKPMPILEFDMAEFFIIRAATQRDLAISTVRGEWYVQSRHAQRLNAAFASGKQVMVFFTVSDSRHIQGAALMTSMAVVHGDDESDEAFSYRLTLEWYRTTELPIKVALEVAPDLLLPTRNTQYCQDMSAKTGEALMKAIWNSPLVSLYEYWGDDPREPPAAEEMLSDFRCPDPDEKPWPVTPGPGFIFGCSSDTMDECLGRGIFGLPAHMKAAAASIVPGSTVFLFNVTDRLLFGVFEALTPALDNIVPTAFSRNPNASSSPFPVQVRVRVSLECPPLEDTDEALNDILRARGTSRIGPVTYAQTEAVASLLASQCGALQYMIEYEQGLQRDPPIAVPPRKIIINDSMDIS